jgi:hypothetical protein
MTMKECYRCEEEKPLEDFRKNKTQEGGYDLYCKKCASAIIKAHYVPYTQKDLRERGQQGALCPLWAKRCKKCFDASVCWRIADTSSMSDEYPVPKRAKPRQ